MSVPWHEAVEALKPLRVRAKQLQVQADQEHEASVQRWKQSERPVLKEHGDSLKQTLHILIQEEATLKSKIANLSTNAVPNHPGTTTGFNVIRSRTDTQGQPLTTDALRQERDRLLKVVDSLELVIAEAKAEITHHHRRNEDEIWETKLVALQDTKRVYREEINLIEVELLGREHHERIQMERLQAEQSGTAELRRLQEHMLQTRIKLNKDKQQFHFPALKGYNITFGGSGIYGACKDICISEINGALSLHAEPGEVTESGTIIKPARMVVIFEAASGATGSDGSSKQASKANGKAAVHLPPRTGSAFSLSAGQSPSKADLANAPGGPVHATPEKASIVAGLQRVSLNQDSSKARRSVTFPDVKPSGSTPPRTTTNLSRMSPLRSGAAVVETQAEAGPYDHHHHYEQEMSGSKRGKGFASRFLKRLGKKKDKFQGKEMSHLQPIDEQDMGSGGKRSLARKLLSRKISKQGVEVSQRLSFTGPGGSSIQESVDDMDDSNSITSSALTEGEEDHGGRSHGSRAPSGGAVAHEDGDGSLASSDDDESSTGDDTMPSTLTSEVLRQASDKLTASGSNNAYGGSIMGGGSSSGRGTWLRAGTSATAGFDAASVLDDSASVMGDLGEPGIDVADDELGNSRGVFVTGRLKGFDLVGERGSKVPNLTIGEADIRATVFVKFVFEYTPDTGWRPGHLPRDKPRFHVENLSYRIRGNNVPMPPTLIKHILRVAIPGLIQRRLLAIMPKEFGDYVLRSGCGFNIKADVGCLGTPLSVLDADLGFEVKGPARSADAARKQQQRYEAAKKARALLGLSLPQAQILAELFNGGAALLDPPRPVSITELISLQAKYERHPQIFKQLCQIMDTSYNLLAEGRNIQDFSFPAFMAGPLATQRLKPARVRVVMRDMKVDLNVDAIVTAIHDFTQRTIEEMVIKGPLNDPKTSLDTMREAVNEELGLLHAWHAFVLRELQHFKSKFRGSAGTFLAAADRWGFSAGMENCFYEGPLRLRLPVNMQLDQDGAFSFEVPLPSPAGKLGVFMDNFKALTVPSHLRPPAQAVNWVEITGDPEVDGRMAKQLATAVGLIEGVLTDLKNKIQQNNLEREDTIPSKVLSQPRTAVGDRLGRFIVNRLKVKVRLDERRIGEILSGINGGSMGDAFTATAGRIIGHLGDVMTMAFTPAAAEVEAGSSAAPLPCSDRYLFQLESSDVSRLRADVQSLGFQSTITPGGAARLVHAALRAVMIAFKESPEEELLAFRQRLEGWYEQLTREALDVSVCLDAKGSTESGPFVVSLSGTADDAHLRASSPMMMSNEIDLVPLGKLMRGDNQHHQQGPKAKAGSSS